MTLHGSKNNLVRRARFAGGPPGFSSCYHIAWVLALRSYQLSKHTWACIICCSNFRSRYKSGKSDIICLCDVKEQKKKEPKKWGPARWSAKSQELWSTVRFPVPLSNCSSGDPTSLLDALHGSLHHFIRKPCFTVTLLSAARLPLQISRLMPVFSPVCLFYFTPPLQSVSLLSFSLSFFLASASVWSVWNWYVC